MVGVLVVVVSVVVLERSVLVGQYHVVKGISGGGPLGDGLVHCDWLEWDGYLTFGGANGWRGCNGGGLQELDW